AELMIHHRLVEHEIESPADFESALAKIGSNGYELSLVEQDDEAPVVRVVETETSESRNVRVPGELLASPIYRNLRQAYARLVEATAAPPFSVGAGKERREAETFESLRNVTLELAKVGMQVSRLKGLGEMNADQLWDT